jgi:hypothetical protein
MISYRVTLILLLITLSALAISTFNIISPNGYNRLTFILLCEFVTAFGILIFGIIKGKND